MTARSPFWISTASGAAFDYASPLPDMICLGDIVHHLTRENRWYNNIEFVSFSVAQHSLLVAAACRLPHSRPYALLHDAAEAYTRDLPTPFKLWLASQGADVVALERRILHQAVFPKLGLPRPAQDVLEDVDRADQIALATEYRDLVKGKAAGFTPSAPPLATRIKFKPQPKIEEEFHLALEAALRPFQKAGS